MSMDRSKTVKTAMNVVMFVMGGVRMRVGTLLARTYIVTVGQVMPIIFISIRKVNIFIFAVSSVRLIMVLVLFLENFAA